MVVAIDFLVSVRIFSLISHRIHAGIFIQGAILSGLLLHPIRVSKWLKLILNSHLS